MAKPKVVDKVGPIEVDAAAEARQKAEADAITKQDELNKEDLADLLDLPKEEPPKVEEPSKEEPKKEEPPKEEIPVEPEPEPEPEEEPGEEPEEEPKEEPEEEDPLLAELGRLTGLIAASERVTPPPKAEVPKETPKETPKQEPPKEQEQLVRDLRTPVETTPVEFIAKDMLKEFDEDDRKVFNTVLNQVVAKVREDTRKQTLQDAMRIFPSMMDYKVQGYIAAQQFWQNNTDLKQLCDKHEKVRTYVEYRATEIQRNNPNWNLGQVYQETEKEVRDLLKDRLLKYQSEQADSPESAKRPALPRRPGAGRKTVQVKPKGLNSEQEQILELINLAK